MSWSHETSGTPGGEESLLGSERVVAKSAGYVSHHLHVGDTYTKVMVFPPENPSDKSHPQPIIVLIFGELSDEARPYVRIHSRCIYGELLESKDCDCAQQLSESLNILRRAKAGILIYLEQEGRGAGILNKARGYALTELQGLDTVEAYKRLGLPPDSRDYSEAVRVLKALRVQRVRLLTNNPRKIRALRSAGLTVDPVRLRIRPTRYDRGYLLVKQLKLGHDLGLHQKVSERIMSTAVRSKATPVVTVSKKS